MNEFFRSLNMVTILGFVAGLLTAVSMLPQVIKTFKEKKAADISFSMLAVLISGICLWIWYDIEKKDFPIIFTNGVSLLINLIMLYLSRKFKNN